MKTKQKWFLIAVLAAFMLAPNAMLMRFALDTWDPYFLNLVRFSLAALILSPITLRNIHRFRGKATKSVLLVCLSGVTVATMNALALNYGPASYYAVIALLTPLVLVWYATKLTNERLSRRALAGITLAASGAVVIVLVPIALSQQHTFVFYPLTTLFTLIAVFVSPLGTVEAKIANERHKIPLFALFGLASIAGTLVSYVLWQTLGSAQMPEYNLPALGAVLYSGIISALLGKALMIKSYERVGAAVNSSLTYFTTLLAILLPVFFLGEKLSLEMVVGGALILFGVFVAEHHKSSHRKHHHIMTGQ